MKHTIITGGIFLSAPPAANPTPHVYVPVSSLNQSFTSVVARLGAPSHYPTPLCALRSPLLPSPLGKGDRRRRWMRYLRSPLSALAFPSGEGGPPKAVDEVILP